MAKDNTNTNKRAKITASVPQHEPGTQMPLFQRRYFNPKDLKANHGQCPGIPENPRFIRDDKYKALLKSMAEDPEFLEIREIAVYDRGTDVPEKERYVCMGGNMRYRAAKELGWTSVPCKVIPTGYDRAKIRRFVLKDNASFGETDWDLLINGFTPDEIASAAIDIPDIADPHASEEEDAEDDNYDVEANTPKVARSKDGDIYRLGNHRLICGDSTKEEYLDALMNGEQADLLVTDPPYNVDYSAKGKMKIANDNMADANFVAFLTDAFKLANDNLKQGGAFYIWHADSQGFNFRTAAQNVGWQIRQCLIWNKNSLVLGRQDYQWKHEPCLYGWKDGASHYFVDKRSLTTVIEEPKDLEKMSKQEMHDLLEKIFIKQELPTTVIDCDKPARNPDHPTMKPVPLIGRLIANSSRRGDTVLDIFGGSGTTLIAAEQLHRKCRMVEFEPIYVDVIIKRWEELTGSKAVLIRNIHNNEKKETKEESDNAKG
ncbi:MAG: DNA modification methylase [Prevotella sp.]